MIGLTLLAIGVIGGGLLWCWLVPKESDRFGWIFWGWVALVGVNAIGLALEVVGYRF